MKALATSKAFWALFLVAVALGVGAWSQRIPILAWYHVRQLTYAYQDNREGCAKRVASLEEAAVPHLLEGLRDGDSIVCANMQAALLLIAENWGGSDPRCLKLIAEVHAAFDGFSTAGRQKTLFFLTGFLQHESGTSLPADVTTEIGRLVVSSSQSADLRAASLLVAAELLDCAPPAEWLDSGRALAERGLLDESPNTRVAAIQLLLRGAVRQEKELLLKVVPLLHDPDPAVRQAALLLLASEIDIVREDVLIPLLHDDDKEVRCRCELALRKRNLGDNDIQLARLISDKDPMIRIRVVDYLLQMPEVNLVEWLRQLSQDPAAAVRAAAVRAAGENPSLNLQDRLLEMAEQDPSDSVRMNASFYLKHRATLRVVSE